MHESVGAFPTLILAAGNYTAVAKHQDQIYSRDFTVEAGLQRDIEVRLADLVQPESRPASSGRRRADGARRRRRARWPAAEATGDVPMEP